MGNIYDKCDMWSSSSWVQYQVLCKASQQVLPTSGRQFGHLFIAHVLVTCLTVYSPSVCQVWSAHVDCRWKQTLRVGWDIHCCKHYQIFASYPNESLCVFHKRLVQTATQKSCWFSECSIVSPCNGEIKCESSHFGQLFFCSTWL